MYQQFPLDGNFKTYQDFKHDPLQLSKSLIRVIAFFHAWNLLHIEKRVV
jgi:hypothetical protein